jgi:hypothetical protein
MKRRTFDTLVSAAGLLLAGLLIFAGGMLTWASTFVGNQVHDQLAAQQIFFPPVGDPSIAAPEYKAVQQYAGQQLTTGAQAEVYANHFIANHLIEIGGGKTYSQLSTESRAQPDNAELAGQVATMFKGETLRGLLLNAYAFGTMGTIAGIAAIVSFGGALLLLLLSGLGIWHARRVPVEKEILASRRVGAVTPAQA